MHMITRTKFIGTFQICYHWPSITSQKKACDICLCRLYMSRGLSCFLATDFLIIMQLVFSPSGVMGDPVSEFQPREH